MERIENIDKSSQEIEEIMSKPPSKFIIVGNLSLVSIIFICIIFSWFFKYPDSFEAEAFITTRTTPQKLYSNTNASLDTALVVNGQKVLKNQIVGILENNSSNRDMLKLYAIMDTISIGPNTSIPKMELPPLYLGNLNEDYYRLEESLNHYHLESTLNPYLNEEFENEISYSENRDKIKNLTKEKSLLQQEIRLIEKKLHRYEVLNTRGAVSDQEYEEIKAELIRLKKSVSQVNSSISSLKKSLKMNLKDSLRINFDNNQKLLEYERDVYESYKTLKNKIKDWEYKFAFKTKIEGVILFHDFWAKNRIINQNDLVFTVVPGENPSYYAQLKVPQKYFGKIKVGQKVLISIDGYPESEFGRLNGFVEKLSSIPIEDNYVVNVGFDNNPITTFRKKIQLNSNMGANAEIITDDMRLLEKFFLQFRRLWNEGNL